MSGRPTAPKRKMPAKKPAPAATKGKAKVDGKPSAPRKPVEAPKPKRKIPVVGIAFAAIAILLVAAIVLTGDVGPGTDEFGEPTVEGDFLPIHRTGQPDTAVGAVAPKVTGDDFSGNQVTIDPDGTPTAVVFLAHWCPHCREEVPRVQAWLDSGGGVEGVEIVSVTTSINSAQANYPPSSWLEGEGWTPPLIRDDTDSTVHSAFGAGGFPFWVFLNGDGTVAARSAGQLDIPTLQGFLQGIATTAS